MSPNLSRRILVAAIGIPAALGIVYLGGWVLVVLVAIFAVVGTQEIFALAERGGVRAVRGVGFLAAAALPIGVYVWMSREGPSALQVALAGAVWIIVVMSAVMAGRSPQDRPLSVVAVTVLGPAYAGGMPAFILVLRHGWDTPSAAAATALVFLPLVVTWLCDTLAMAGGAVVGGAKLAPVLSPNKTWAGAVSGSIAAVIAAPLYGALVLEPFGVGAGAGWLALFGLVIAVVGQAGDVAESLLKREAGVKDSGKFFPGHGGVLDRFDSLYWVLPTSVLLLGGLGIL
ncbi:MAG: phosphatidate cytidylyltransferase [Gemmatimonadales bacterium]